MRIKSTLAAIGLMVAGVAVVVLPGSPALAATCPNNNWSIKDGRVGNFYSATNVNIRTGTGTNCTSVGQGQPSHTIRLDCYRSGDGGFWSHIYDFTTARGGWSKDEFIQGEGTYGALAPC